MILKTVELEKGFVYQHIAYGDFECQDLLARVKFFWMGNKFPALRINILWDVEKVNFATIHLSEIELLAANILKLGGAVRPGRTAILIEEGFARHVFSFLEIELGQDFLREFRVFTDKDEALAFIMDADEFMELDQCA